MERSDDDIQEFINGMWPDLGFTVVDLKKPNGERFRHLLMLFLELFYGKVTFAKVTWLVYFDSNVSLLFPTNIIFSPRSILLYSQEILKFFHTMKWVFRYFGRSMPFWGNCLTTIFVLMILFSQVSKQIINFIIGFNLNYNYFGSFSSSQGGSKCTFEPCHVHGIQYGNNWRDKSNGPIPGSASKRRREAFSWRKEALE